MKGLLRQCESGCQRAIQLLNPPLRQRAQVIRQNRFRQAHQFIATDRGVMFQSIFHPNVHLCGQAQTFAEYRGADYRVKIGMNEPFAAHYHIRALPLRVERRGSWDEIQFAALHLVEVSPVLEHIRNFLVQVIGVSVHDFEISQPLVWLRRQAQIHAHRTLYKPRPVGISLIDLGQQFLREQN